MLARLQIAKSYSDNILKCVISVHVIEILIATALKKQLGWKLDCNTTRSHKPVHFFFYFERESASSKFRLTFFAPRPRPEVHSCLVICPFPTWSGTWPCARMSWMSCTSRANFLAPARAGQMKNRGRLSLRHFYVLCD